MRYKFVVLLASAVMAVAAAPADQPSPAFFQALRVADGRVAAIGYRLKTANAALCRSTEPTIGVAMHALSQYGPQARAAADRSFRFETGVQIEAVVPGSPAAIAGLTPGDSLVAVAGAPVAKRPNGDDQGGAQDRIAAEQLIAGQPTSQPISLMVRRGGVDRSVIVKPVPGCRASVEMMLGNGLEADSDGDTIRIAARYLEDYDDAQVAVILAHELGHTIMLHRSRLDAAKVDRGLLAEVGRNGRLFRETEDQADQMSVYALYNAGYDPMSAARFWDVEGRKIDGGLFRSRTHRSAAARAKRVAAEAALIPAGARRPYIPPMLALRDQPLR